VVRYGAVTALHGISLHVNAGELVSVVGPNGAGKSTMLWAVMGTVPLKNGVISLAGRSLAGMPPENIVRSGIALVPERRHIFTQLSVLENLLLGATPRKDRAGVKADIVRMLDLFPVLETCLHTSAGKLSGGQQQQLAIARALLSRPRLLLVDEPSLGLAPIVTDKVYEVLQELVRAGIAILLIEQSSVRALNIADRVYLLRSGQIERSGNAGDLREAVDLEDSYFGFESGVDRPSGGWHSERS